MGLFCIYLKGYGIFVSILGIYGYNAVWILGIFAILILGIWDILQIINGILGPSPRASLVNYISNLYTVEQGVPPGVSVREELYQHSITRFSTMTFYIWLWEYVLILELDITTVVLWPAVLARLAIVLQMILFIIEYHKTGTDMAYRQFCFVALCPKSTAMVMMGWSVHLTTLFPGQAWTSG